MRTKDEQYACAQTIIRQLGGHGALNALQGAHRFLITDDGLQFRTKVEGADGINSIVIELDANDTYTVKLYRIDRRHTVELIHEINGVHADGLLDLLERKTANAWRVPRIGNPSVLGST